MVKRIFFEHHTCYNPGDPAGISGAWQPGGFSSKCPEHHLSSATLLGHAANLGLGAFPWLFFVLLHKKMIYLFFIKMKHLHHSKAVQHMLFKIKILRSSGENLGDELLEDGPAAPNHGKAQVGRDLRDHLSSWTCTCNCFLGIIASFSRKNLLLLVAQRQAWA